MDTIYSPYNVDLQELMSNQSSWEVFANKFIKLPRSIKDLMLTNSAEFLWSLGHRLNLSEDQSSELSRIIRDILLGDIFIGDMAAIISQKLNEDLSAGKSIANEIVRDLFMPAIEDIKRIQKEKFGDRPREEIRSNANPGSQIGKQAEINQSNVIDLRNQS